jgi:hypothetical protein
MTESHENPPGRIVADGDKWWFSPRNGDLGSVGYGRIVHPGKEDRASQMPVAVCPRLFRGSVNIQYR